MIELQRKYRPYFYIASVMSGIEALYFLNVLDAPKSGWAVYCSLIALAVSMPMLIGGCLGLISGYMVPSKKLIFSGLIFGLLWFVFALAALSKLASIVAILVSFVSYKMLQYHHKDVGAVQPSVRANDHVSGGPTV